MKECKRCGATKSVSQFYAHDGSCKACRILLVKEYRKKNIKRIQEYDRNRPNKGERIAATKRRYRRHTSTPEGRERLREHRRKWAQEYRNSDKRAAHVIAGNAIRDGRLVKQPCKRCGSPDNIHAHHEDYTKPMEVTWLCRPCHGERHREINEGRRVS